MTIIKMMKVEIKVSNENIVELGHPMYVIRDDFLGYQIKKCFRKVSRRIETQKVGYVWVI